MKKTAVILGAILCLGATQARAQYNDGGTHDLGYDEYFYGSVSVDDDYSSPSEPKATTVNLWVNTYLDSLYVSGTSTVNMSSLGDPVTPWDLPIVENIWAVGNSTVNIYDGSCLFIIADGTATINIHGGDYSNLNAWDAGTINICGSGFTIYDGTDWVSAPPSINESCWLQGTLEDGISLYAACNVDPGAVINLQTQSEPETLSVVIDIKPGSATNVVNLGSNGVVPVAILSTTDFDATTAVNPDTIKLAGAGVAVRGKSSKALVCFEDVNNDGLLDLVAHVVTENLEEVTTDGKAILTGETFDGQPIEGGDTITIVPK
jgi:hypothetical protein